ncbi:diguanylate cyclase [Tamilnaduibacter salinus]|uniref:Diguanylate cyclase n=1 Tax=Tamilnaduibacter salinus TaxID=1484056 RepID=A0A2A2I1G0_9GAMM|nr:diguanylate cyclase [Tamilnaduibacter salinus]PAV25136.1 diguanylate cyclase [Tamilnaduibacter salinus]
MLWKQIAHWLDSVRHQAVGVMVFVVVFTVLTATVVGTITARDELASQARDGARTMAGMVANRIDGLLDERYRAVTRAADGLTMSSEALEGRAQLLLKRQQVLSELMDNLYLVDERGDLLAALPEDARLAGVSIDDREYFQRATGQMTTVISQPMVSRNGQTPVVVIAAPVFDHVRRLTGVLLGSFDLTGNNFTGRINELTLGRTGYVTVGTRSGTMLAHPNPQHINQPVPGTNPAIQSALAGEEGVRRANNRDGQTVLVAYRQLNEAPWFVTVAIPIREAYAPVYRLYWTVFWVVLVTVVVIVPLTLRVFSRLLRPLEDLAGQIVERHAGRRTEPVRVGGGLEIRRVATTFNDVMAEREEAAWHLEEREAFFRSLSERAPTGIAQADVEGHLAYTNGAFQAILGLPAEEIRGYPMSRWIDSRDRPEVVDEWRRAVASGNVYYGRLRLVRDDGQVVWVEAMTSGVEAHDRQLGTVTVVRDITHEHQLEQRLRAERNRAESTLRVMQEGVLLTDASGVIRSANPPAARFLGLNEPPEGTVLFEGVRITADDRSWTLEDFLTSPALNSLDAILENARKERFEVELTLIRPDRSDEDELLVFVIRDDRERRREEERLSWQATHDSLTRLANRRAFNDVLTRLVAENVRPTALMLIDLDHFKPVNDTGGHLVGDHLLKRLAEALQNGVRQSDLVARLGGDEFAVILTGCDMERASVIAENLRGAIANLAVADGSRTYRVTASIGLTALGEDDHAIRDVVNRADEAAYEAKRLGRNRVVIDPDEIVVQEP